ncbi:MAG: hypothetical protein ACOC1K_04995 [Nanoarchaeota archaeon]
MLKGIKFIQTKKVGWLTQPKGTIWISTGFENYIVPQLEQLRDTPLGVDLSLLYDEDEKLFRIYK